MDFDGRNTWQARQRLQDVRQHLAVALPLGPAQLHSVGKLGSQGQAVGMVLRGIRGVRVGLDHDRNKVSNGMGAPTRSGINVPKWKRYFNHLNREGRPS